MPQSRVTGARNGSELPNNYEWQVRGNGLAEKLRLAGWEGPFFRKTTFGGLKSGNLMGFGGESLELKKQGQGSDLLF